MSASRVKLPKTFLAVNLSDAFTFQEKERRNSEADVLEMKGVDRAAISSPAPPGDEQPHANGAPEATGDNDTRVGSDPPVVPSDSTMLSVASDSREEQPYTHGISAAAGHDDIGDDDNSAPAAPFYPGSS